MAYEFTIIIPIYNEAPNILALEKALLEFIPIALKQTKVLFINDGSTDNSAVLLQTICSRNTEFSYISFTKNNGLSAAIKAGFDLVQTNLTGYMDADLQTSPKEFNQLLQHIDNYDLVTGVRVNRQDSFTKKITSKIANSIRRAFTKDGMDDTGCPLKVFQTTTAKRIPMFSGLHRFLPAMVQLQHGTVLQIPVQHYPRNAGKGKFTTWNRLIGPLLDCFVFLWMKKRYINYKITDNS